MLHRFTHGCVVVTVSSPSDYDTAPDVMEPADTPVLRSETLFYSESAFPAADCADLTSLDCQI